MSLEHTAEALLGHRVRVWPAFDIVKAGQPVIEGKVVGFARDPMLVIAADDGRVEDWQVSLPLEDLGEQEHTPDRVDVSARHRAAALRDAYRAIIAGELAGLPSGTRAAIIDWLEERAGREAAATR